MSVVYPSWPLSIPLSWAPKAWRLAASAIGTKRASGIMALSLIRLRLLETALGFLGHTQTSVLGPQPSNSERVPELEVRRAPLDRDHSVPLQLIETNGPPAHGKNEPSMGPLTSSPCPHDHSTSDAVTRRSENSLCPTSTDWTTRPKRRGPCDLPELRGLCTGFRMSNA